MSDYIKREAAIKALDDIKNINEDSWLGARYALKHNIPSADVRENVKGEWVVRKDTTECSSCHTKWRDYRGLISTFSFCPDCGADMRGDL